MEKLLTHENRQSAIEDATISPVLHHERISLILIGFGVFVFFIMLYSYETQTLFYAWDGPVLQYFTRLQEGSPPWMTPTARMVGKLGSQGITAITIVLLAVWAFQRRARHFFLLFASVVGVELLWLPLVFGIGRPRPTEVRTVFDIVLPSYPSGHVMIFIAFFGVLVYLYFARVRDRFWRWIILIVLMGALLLTGWVRLYFSAHYLTDVLGGYGAGLAWTVAALLGVDWYFLRRGKQAPA